MCGVKLGDELNVLINECVLTLICNNSSTEIFNCMILSPRLNSLQIFTIKFLLWGEWASLYIVEHSQFVICLLFWGFSAVYVEDPVIVPRALFEFLRATDLLQEWQAVLVAARPQSTSVQTIYVIVWASPNFSLHTGEIENADEFWKNHAIPLL
jgi:hypothetical protein